MAQLQQCCIPGEKSLAMLGPSAYLRIYQREDPEIASVRRIIVSGEGGSSSLKEETPGVLGTN